MYTGIDVVIVQAVAISAQLLSKSLLAIAHLLCIFSDAGFLQGHDEQGGGASTAG